MSEETVRDRYRKLPGHRRGILRSASVWMGADHLLSVKSLRFREEYKRFHLRDVQAIVVVRTPRYHISTRALAIGWLWSIALTLVGTSQPAALMAMGLVGLGLVGAWAYVSAAASCRCRIYTAVSGEELPSVYRTWTARRFLAEVEPRIRAVQGVLEGNWAETVEEQRVGPAAPPPPFPVTPVAAWEFAGGVPPPPRPVKADETSGARVRTVVTDVFLASLFGDALLNVVTLHSLTKTLQWLWYVLAFLQVGCAAMIFVERHRGILKSGMQKLAIATLIAMGAGYYFRQVLEGVARSTQPGLPESQVAGYEVLRGVEAGIAGVLGLVGVLLIVADRVREDA